MLRWGAILLDGVYTPNHQSLPTAASPAGRLLGSGDHGVRIREVSLTIIPSGPLWKLVLPAPQFWTLQIQRFWLSQRVSVSAHLLEFFHAEKPAGKDPDLQEKMSLLLCNDGRKDRGRHASDPLRCHLVLPCPILLINGQMQQAWPKKDIIIRDSDPSGIRVQVTPPCMPPGPAKMLTKGQRNLEETVQEGNYKQQLRTVVAVSSIICSH